MRCLSLPHAREEPVGMRLTTGQADQACIQLPKSSLDLLFTCCTRRIFLDAIFFEKSTIGVRSTYRFGIVNEGCQLLQFTLQVHRISLRKYDIGKVFKHLFGLFLPFGIE